MVRLSLVAAALLALPAAAQMPMQSAPPVFGPDEIVIYPVHDAQILAGSTFDVVVDVPQPADAPPPLVMLAGKPAAETLGAPPEEVPVGPGRRMLRWRKVTLPHPGELEVAVTAAGRKRVVRWTVREPSPSAGATNVVLLVADGMTVAGLTAARMISRGMDEGRYRGALAIDGMEEIGLSQTSALDSIVSDSSNTASAMLTGHKARVASTGIYVDATPDPTDDPRVETFAEMVQRTRKMAIGVVSTAELNDATPVAAWGHCRDRLLVCRASMIRAVIDEGIQPDVLLGGGMRWLRQQDRNGRVRDLSAELDSFGYRVVSNATELRTAVAKPEALPSKLFGAFHPAHLSVWLDRNVYPANTAPFRDQPGLVEMTEGALRVLERRKEGFFLYVEAASVDKMLHRLDHDRAMADLIEFDRAVDAVLRWRARSAPDTLVVVTSDHGHGYDVYGTVDAGALRDAEDQAGKLDAISIYVKGAAGFTDHRDADGDGFPDDWAVARPLAATANNGPDHTEDFAVNPTPRIPASVTMLGGAQDNPTDDPHGVRMHATLPPGGGSPSQAVHTMQDVPVFASGPGADWFGRVIDQTEIFFGMARAIGLDPRDE